MNQITVLHTADVTFRLAAPLPVVSRDTLGVYDTFLPTGDLPPGDPVIMVRLHVDCYTGPAPQKKIFDSENSWSVFLDDNVRHVVGGGGPDPDWIARLHSGFLDADVYCGTPMLAEADGIRVIRNPVSLPLDLIFTMYVLSACEGAIVHGAGAVINGKGFLMPGQSGAGKTTISQLFSAGGEGILLSDDRAVVRKIGDGHVLFGTPWAGDARIALNDSAPLHGILFLVQAPENEIRPISMTDAFERMMAVTSIPWYDAEVIPPLLSFCESLVGEVPVYELRFRRDESVVDLLAEFASM
ncbi:MAG: hypothetical protein QGI24_10260 [Kiritimatiellia bacterium]|jgi:hypothetical protein|nr:hypothetical protein [Kiritimatiellia bacterium]MDP6849156.1 hypothetical protein [Kiritimatiellia bacterium]